MRFTSPPFVTGLSCLICGATHPYGNRFTCPVCGIQGILDVQFAYGDLAESLKLNIQHRSFDHWRYRELLPISPDLRPPHLHVGWTPVYDLPRLAHVVGVRKFFLKDDGGNPTGSLKDRASSIGVMKAMEFGFDTIACASTGNAASSLAGFSAAVGLRSYIFVPERVPEPKITQILVFGATVLKVKGSYEDAFTLCKEACDQFGWYNRNSGTNPFLVEGKKTAGLEIGEYFGKNIPEWVVMPVGDGCTISGIGKGLREMKRIGFIERMPRLLGVQAEGARPILEAFVAGKELIPSPTNTIADSIAVGTPRNWRRAIQQIKLSHGDMIAVTDAEILEAMKVTARIGGVFGELAGVAGIAGLKKAVEQNIVKSNETAVVVVTGNGLKDIQSARRVAGREIIIEPTIDSLSEALAVHLRKKL